jgi:hypothetical protein
MPKRRLRLKMSLPPYAPPRNTWRRQIHAAAFEAKMQRNVTYSEDDRLEVHVVLGLTASEALIHDVDNRLKDILDALQGRAGGAKNVQFLERIIPNDRQVYRVSVEKSPRRDAKGPSGRVIVRKLQQRKPSRGNAR